HSVGRPIGSRRTAGVLAEARICGAKGERSMIVRGARSPFRRVVVQLAMVVGLALAPVSALAETTGTTVTVPMETITNPCVAEEVAGSGRIKQTVTANVSAGGSVLLHFHTDQLFQGVGSVTGAKYVSSTIEDQDETGQLDGLLHFEITHLSSFRVLSQGADENFYEFFLTHVTVTNGDATAETFQLRSECR